MWNHEADPQTALCAMERQARQDGAVRRDAAHHRRPDGPSGSGTAAAQGRRVGQPAEHQR